MKVYEIYLLKNGEFESKVTCNSCAEADEVKAKHLAQNNGTTYVSSTYIREVKNGEVNTPNGRVYLTKRAKKHFLENPMPYAVNLVYEVVVEDDSYEDKEVVYYLVKTLTGLERRYGFESEEEARNFVEQHKYGFSDGSEEWEWGVFEYREIHRIYVSGSETEQIGEAKITQL